MHWENLGSASKGFLAPEGCSEEEIVELMESWYTLELLLSTKPDSSHSKS